ncbi:class I SAM-dependent methyltransferase [Vallitalea okinawensis]|uniref:class I SAM-dependent methyltransferase n=1 Tax=Vallitalea okinawensis TaxID=2078660 RepID=UPI001FA86F30|nr:class I SAM-dependent methyltransferase [Vallitalea okinawensis]
MNYNELSKKYDNVRESDVELIKMFLDEVNMNANSKILDFGCGTGNYMNSFHKLTDAQIYGLEPSDGMRQKAIRKNPNLIITKGNHEKIPYNDDFFDFVYMTDVIHHVLDLKLMFKEIRRVLKESGKLCIITQSHSQIEKRFYASYFPSTIDVDKERYPDIDEIQQKAEERKFKWLKNVEKHRGRGKLITPEFIKLVEDKGFSMLHLIPEGEYIKGLADLKADAGKENELTTAGSMLVWFEK